MTRPRFVAGDLVLFRSYQSEVFGELRTGVIRNIAENGKLFEVIYNGYPHWRRAWRLRLIGEPKLVEVQRPAVVDARVLEEVTAIQRSLGSTEALLDLLGDIRKTYGKDAEVGS
jgi:trehalose-6-phosphate synthase